MREKTLNKIDEAIIELKENNNFNVAGPISFITFDYFTKKYNIKNRYKGYGKLTNPENKKDLAMLNIFCVISNKPLWGMVPIELKTAIENRIMSRFGKNGGLYII